MAKKRAINKSQAIRDLYEEKPDIGPTEAAKILNERFEKQGVEFTPSGVSDIVSKSKKSQATKVAAPKPPSPAQHVRIDSPGTFRIEDLQLVKKLVAEIGPDAVRSLVEVVQS